MLEIIQKDASFFRDCGIIDYSMLVGVHEIKRPRDELDSPSNHSQSMISEIDQPPNSTRGSYYNAVYGNVFAAESIVP